MKTYEITVSAPESMGGERTIKQQADYYHVDEKGNLTLLRHEELYGATKSEPVLVVAPGRWLMLRLVEDEA